MLPQMARCLRLRWADRATVHRSTLHVSVLIRPVIRADQRTLSTYQNAASTSHMFYASHPSGGELSMGCVFNCLMFLVKYSFLIQDSFSIYWGQVFRTVTFLSTFHQMLRLNSLMCLMCILLSVCVRAYIKSQNARSPGGPIPDDRTHKDDRRRCNNVIGGNHIPSHHVPLHLDTHAHTHTHTHTPMHTHTHTHTPMLLHRPISDLIWERGRDSTSVKLGNAWKTQWIKATKCVYVEDATSRFNNLS